MKKFICLLCMISIVLSMAACGNSSGTSSGATTPPASTGETNSGGSTGSGEPAKPANYPKKDIKVIIPFSAGGGADLSMRIFCEVANNGDFFEGVTLVPENIPAGGAVIGQTAAFNAAPDGYTMLLYTSSLINNDIFNDVVYKYDDFKPLAGYCSDPEILLAPPNAPYSTLEEFYEYAKTHTVNVSTPGHTTGHHIRGLKMAKDKGFDFKYMHSDGAAVQLQQIMGGHCDVSFTTVGACVSQVQEGAVKALAIMANERLEDIPDVPTFKELGEDLVDGANRGIAVHKDVPDDIYQYLCAEAKKVIETPEFAEREKDLGVIGNYQTPEEYREYMDKTYNTITELLPLLQADAEASK